MRSAGGLDRPFWLLWASSALCFLSVGAYAPVLPVYVRGELGGGPTEIGLVTGATAAIAILLRPGAGAFGDRRGRRLASVLGGVLLAAAPLILLAPGLLAVALLARLFVGLGEALLNVATTAWAFDRAPQARRARVMGMFSTSIWIGFGVGPQVAEALRGAWGFDAVWAWCAVTALAAGLVARLVPMPERHATAHDPLAERSLRERLAAALEGPRAAAVPGAIVALALLGEGALQAFGVEHLVDRGVAPGGGVGGAASVFTVFAIAALLARVPAGDLVDRAGSHLPAAGALVLVAAGWTLMSVASSFAAAAVASAMVGVGISVLFPALSLIVTDRVHPSARGAALGGYIAFMDVGLGIGAVGGGLVVHATSTQALFTIGAAGAVVGAGLVLVDARRPPGRATAHGSPAQPRRTAPAASPTA
jgi:MFS family permease